MSDPAKPPAEEELPVPMPVVTRFIQQLSHDLRNHLNAAELQSAYLNELVDGAETKDEIKRLRAMLGEMGASLQRLTSSIAAIRLTLMPYEAKDFVEDLQQKIGIQVPEQSGEIEWQVAVGNEVMEIDPQMLQAALLEIFANAWRHERGSGPLRASVEVAGGQFVFTLAEPKTNFTGATAEWGCQPFANVKHGHYGLGLPRVRSIINAHHGQLRAHYDPAASTLVSTVVVPIAPAG